MNDVDWGVRAAAWELAAFSFRYPGAELEGAVASGEWAAAAREIAGALRATALPEGLGEGLSGRSGPGDVLHALRRRGRPACSWARPSRRSRPTKGVWRAADDGVQALLFVNPHSMEVERFMQAPAAWAVPRAPTSRLDHVATECELAGAPGPARRRRRAARGRSGRLRPPRRLARGGLRGLPRGARPRLDAPLRRSRRRGVAHSLLLRRGRVPRRARCSIRRLRS